tara:strand:+ start:476 stop:682 length:207 start_codon:yes stop_codon:yes gene_type:complete
MESQRQSVVVCLRSIGCTKALPNTFTIPCHRDLIGGLSDYVTTMGATPACERGLSVLKEDLFAVSHIL